MGLVSLAPGIQRLIDSAQRFASATQPVYLRLRNFTPPSTAAAALGFPAVSSASGGITDCPVIPPPSVRMISTHNIGMSNGKLRFGAKEFLVSATFVTGQLSAMNLTDPALVWRSPLVVGLVTDGLLYSIELVTHQEIGGNIITWRLSCNANELR